VTFRTT